MISLNYKGVQHRRRDGNQTLTVTVADSGQVAGCFFDVADLASRLGLQDLFSIVHILYEKTVKRYVQLQAVVQELKFAAQVNQMVDALDK